MTAYTATTSNTTNAVTATTEAGDAVITVNGTEIDNGSRVTWDDGENIVAVTVTHGEAEKTYTVTVTKS